MINRSKGKLMCGLAWKSTLFCFLAFGAFLFLGINVYYFNFVTKSVSSAAEDKFISCLWEEGDPVLLNLRTKSGVNYEGGHWFHVAENFMVQHSILRSTYRLANSSHVYFNIDKS